MDALLLLPDFLLVQPAARERLEEAGVFLLYVQGLVQPMCFPLRTVEKTEQGG